MKKFIKSIVHTFGIDVIKYPPVRLPHQSTVDYHKLLKSHQVDMILDVGANTGQYALSLLQGGFKGKVVSFEPMTREWNMLKEKSVNYPNWTIEERVAIGNKETVAEFNISSNSVSSSLLPLTSSTLETCPDTRFVSKETVQVTTLNAIAKKHVEAATNPFLKLDIQGFEYYALQGADQIIDKCVGLHVELGLEPLYEGEKNMNEMFNYIIGELNFAPFYLIPHSTTEPNGRLLQVDAVFYRKGK